MAARSAAYTESDGGNVARTESAAWAFGGTTRTPPPLGGVGQAGTPGVADPGGTTIGGDGLGGPGLRTRALDGDMSGRTEGSGGVCAPVGLSGV